MSSPSLNIAIVAACPFPLPRGTPVRILRIAEALVERGHSVHVITYHLGTGEVNGAIKIHRIRDLPNYQKLSPGPTYKKLFVVDVLLERLLRTLLRKHSFDVIHAHHYEGLLVSAIARRGLRIPLVYDAHTLLMSELPYYRLGLPMSWKRSLGKWLDSGVPRLANHTVCVTNTIRDKLVYDAGISAEKVSVASNGVEYEHFDPDRQAPRPQRPVGQTLIFTGNLAEYQGIDLMLKAFRQVRVQLPEARLVIATDSSFQPYEALASELGIRKQIDIVASPKFSELPALLAAADVAVNPRTDGDGVPVKLLNYMAAGCAVVSYEGSAPGVVHGQTGWLVKNGDVSALADGIVMVMKNPELARELGSAARCYVAENCRWSVAAERCESIYRSLIEAMK